MSKTIQEIIADSYDELEAKETKDLPSESAAPIEEKDVVAELEAPAAAEPTDVAVDTKTPTPAPTEIDIPAPASLTATMKAKWKDLPADFRAEFARHEDERHKAMTRHDGDLQLGRDVKEVVTPYMPLLRSYGVEPKAAIGDMMNTYHILYQGTPTQKANLIRETIRQHGIDVNSLVGEQPQGNPEINALREELYNLRQQANPEYIKNTLRESFEHDSVTNEVRAFASDPANLHYETVKPLMASLLGTGAAMNMKEAYTLACNAHPDVSSILSAERKAAEAEKRKAELDAKRKASTSIAGSSGVSVPNTRATKSPQDTVAAVWESMTGSLIT